MKTLMKIFVPVTLGMLTAFGPIITDFYLPVLPEMAEFFKTTPSLASMSLTFGMIGLAAGQVCIGPLTDKYGRKKILVASMVLFVVASVLCIFSTSIYFFNAMRLLQGVAGAGGIVISKSMSTDMYTGRELANFMAVLGAINGIAPIFAPVLGGLMASVASWQGVFALMLGLGVVITLCCMALRETLRPADRLKSNLGVVYGNLFNVFRNWRFRLATLAAMACFFAFFAYISSSPFILQKIYGLSPLQFSICFGVNAFSVGIGAAVATQFKNPMTALKCGAIDMFIAAVCLAFCLVTGMPLLVVMGFFIYMMVSFGLMQPGLTSIALDSERANAGAASAIFGASEFVAGAIASPLVGIGRIEVASGALFVAGSLVCLVLVLKLVSKIYRVDGKAAVKQ